MCGLVGAFKASGAKWEHTDKIEEFMKRGLFLNSWRGVNGTGLGLLMDDNEVEIYKSPLDSPTFLQTQQATVAFRDIQRAKAILGHTRAATIGNTAPDNAHPFRYISADETRDITLIHNGTIQNYHSLTPTGFHHPVDSAHVAYALAAEEDALAVLNRLRGAFVLIWYNAVDRTLHLAKNEERTLYMAYLGEKKDKMVFISEQEMLAFLGIRIGLPYHGKLRMVPAFVHHVWHLDNKTLEGPDKIPFDQPKPFVSNVRTYEHSKWSGYHTGRPPVVANGGSTTNHTPPLAAGQPIWAKLNDWTVFTKSKESPKEEQFGYVSGVRAGFLSDRVYIQNVPRPFWDDYMSGVANSCPLKILRSEVANGITTYHCSFDPEKIMFEYNSNRPGDSVKGPKGQLISRHQFREISKNGCLFCTDSLGVEAANTVRWINLGDSRVPRWEPCCSKCETEQRHQIESLAED
jgi:predicted glutamine amidotransferase